uniref:Uncharacterized protein n=1 Tax=Anguilla anguilla TaxID=7936 RepID=A0A0E9Q9Y0_ANGAN
MPADEGSQWKEIRSRVITLSLGWLSKL